VPQCRYRIAAMSCGPDARSKLRNGHDMRDIRSPLGIPNGLNQRREGFGLRDRGTVSLPKRMNEQRTNPRHQPPRLVSQSASVCPMSVAHLMGYVTWMIIAPLLSSCLRSTFVRNLLDVVKAWARAGGNLTGDDLHIRRDGCHSDASTRMF